MRLQTIDMIFEICTYSVHCTHQFQICFFFLEIFFALLCRIVIGQKKKNSKSAQNTFWKAWRSNFEVCWCLVCGTLYMKSLENATCHHYDIVARDSLAFNWHSIDLKFQYILDESAVFGHISVLVCDNVEKLALKMYGHFCEIIIAQ